MKTWFIVLLLCVGVFAQAWAMPNPRCVCPPGMSGDAATTAAATAAADADTDTDDDAEAEDCCNDARTAALTGQACKLGQASCAATAVPTHATAVAVSSGVFTLTAPRVSAPHTAGLPSPVWRPPMPR